MQITYDMFLKANLDNRVFNNDSTRFISQSFSENNSQIDFNELHSLNEFEEYKIKNINVWNSRLRLEENLSKLNQNEFNLIGINPVSKKKVNFNIGGKRKNKVRNGVRIHNFRESLIDSEVGLNSRLRSVVVALEKNKIFDSSISKDIYLTEEITPFYNFIRKSVNLENVNLYGSEYLGNSYKSGELVNGVNHQDLTNLSFESSTLDTIVSLEVLEHIPDYQVALKEIYRVLKPGGQCFITVPFALNNFYHIERAKLNKDGVIEHILPPEYHGDPVNPQEGVLCYRYYGWKLLDELKTIGFNSSKMLFVWSIFYGIIGGTELSIIYAKK